MIKLKEEGYLGAGFHKGQCFEITLNNIYLYYSPVMIVKLLVENFATIYFD